MLPLKKENLDLYPFSPVYSLSDLGMAERLIEYFKFFALKHSDYFEAVMREQNARLIHVHFVLAYMIVKYLAKAWKQIDLTVEEGLSQLSSLSSIEITVKGVSAACQRIPEPNEKQKELLSAIQVNIPKILPKSSVHVVSRRKLVERRLT